jgi:hypothetical protein
MNYDEIFILATDEITDGVGSHLETETLLADANRAGLRVADLKIASLREPWGTSQNNIFKSGASAIEAIDHGNRLLRSNIADLVYIHGQDDLKSGYEKSDRKSLMNIFGHDYSPMMAYSNLTETFLNLYQIRIEDYLVIRDALFENYCRRRQKVMTKLDLPGQQWFEDQSLYFRGVDCANPVIDYSGRLIISNRKNLEVLGLDMKKLVKVAGNSFVSLDTSGIESIPEIVKFNHLKRAIELATSEANLNFVELLMKGEAELEAYTCYPIIPIALLKSLGIVSDFSSILKFLNQYEITLSGGLNLNRAPWSLTSLRSLIGANQRIRSSATNVIMVHGNGSLGEYQGITILKRH